MYEYTVREYPFPPEPDPASAYEAGLNDMAQQSWNPFIVIPVQRAEGQRLGYGGQLVPAIRTTLLVTFRRAMEGVPAPWTWPPSQKGSTCCSTQAEAWESY
jgi:hypothetical protein